MRPTSGELAPFCWFIVRPFAEGVEKIPRSGFSPYFCLCSYVAEVVLGV